MATRTIGRFSTPRTMAYCRTERVFVVSILGGGHFEFPERVPLNKRLVDILEPEEEVGEKYYIPNARISKMIQHCERKQAEGCGFKFEPKSGDSIANSVTTCSGSRETDNYMKVDDELF